MLVASPANAAGLDGLWSVLPQNCAVQPGDDRVPLEISGKDWIYYESACTASKETGKVRFACTGEGMEWTAQADVTLSGDTLTVTEDGATTVYKRCK